MSFKHYFCLTLVCFNAFYVLQGARTIEGDQLGKGQFSFALGPSAFATRNGLLFVGADQDKANNEYALAWCTRGMDYFIPLALATTELNGKEKQPNPLTGTALNFISLMKEGSDLWPLVVSRTEPNRLYLMQTYHGEADSKSKRIKTSGISMLSSSPLTDAQGQPAAEVLGIAGGYPYIIVPVRAADVPLREGFDVAVSFFYYGVRQEIHKQTTEQKKKEQKEVKATSKQHSNDEKEIDAMKIVKAALKKSYLSVLNAITGKPDAPQALSIRLDNPLIGLGGPADSFSHTQVPIHWAEVVGQWYIPLQVTAGSTAQSGACALLVSSFSEEKGLTLKSFIPPSAFEGDTLVLTQQPGQCVSVFHVASMGTTTWLPYLIMVGGIGEPSIAKRQVSALPVVGGPDITIRGTVAKKDQLPMSFFSGDQPSELSARTFLIPATKPEDVPHRDDPAVQVGAGFAPGPVTDLKVKGDAVFVTVEATEDCLGGVFHSQALFDKEGRITAWTAWQPVAGIQQPIKGFELDEEVGQYWYIQESNEVMRTEWDKPEFKGSGLSEVLNSLFKSVPSGIQDLQAYGYNNQGMSSTQGKKAAMLVATGYRHVVLLETGSDAQGSCKPVVDFGENFFISDSGSLKEFEQGVAGLKITGGVLQELGPIVASTIVTDGRYAWLAVAGSGGVAVLAHPDGTGWPANEGKGLGHGFEGLSPRMRFIKLGSYKNVHKLVAYQDKLFVVSPTVVDCYTFSSRTLKESTLAGAPLARKGLLGVHTYFLDAWASDRYLFLGTDRGLVYHSFEQACVQGECSGWKALDIPYSAGEVSRIYPVVAGKQLDGYVSANLYLVNGSASADRARIYRYALSESDATVQLDLLPDIMTQESGRAFFINLGVYRNFFTTDGSVAFFTGSLFGKRDASVDFCLIDTKTRQRDWRRSAQTVLTLPGRSIIGPVIREPASGAWLVWGDFGVRFCH